MSDTTCALVAEVLRRVRMIRTLNLADCLLTFDGLKYFLDVANELKNLSLLNLKGNQIGNNKTLYVSKMISFNRSITEYAAVHSHRVRWISMGNQTILFDFDFLIIFRLRLDWNKMGDSVDTFAQLCSSLLSNTILTTLNLSNNNLGRESCSHLAKALSANKCLKNIGMLKRVLCRVL